MLPSDARIEPGTVLAGKYRVERTLGQGGMGVIVRAHDELLHRHVALKLLTSAAVDGQGVERFLREARAAVRIQSAHVAQIIEVGALEDGSPFIAMELLEGNDLSNVLATRGRLPVPEAVDAVLQALDAIAEAHSLGIVHRDLKPANLFWASRADGTHTIKVLDFGISKVTMGDETADKAALTHTGAIMGSPLYMSPEQLRSTKRVDARADLWSLGVILYELLAGQVPFDGESLGEVFAAVLESDPTPLRSLRPDVPVELEDVIRRCLRRRPDERFANAAELALALAPFGSGRADGCVARASLLLKTAPAPPGSNLRTATLAMRSSGSLPSSASTGRDPADSDPALVVGATGGRPLGSQTSSSWEDSGSSAAARAKRPIWLLAAVGIGTVLTIGGALVAARQWHRATGPAPHTETTTAPEVAGPASSVPTASSADEGSPVTATAATPNANATVIASASGTGASSPSANAGGGGPKGKPTGAAVVAPPPPTGAKSGRPAQTASTAPTAPKPDGLGLDGRH